MSDARRTITTNGIIAFGLVGAAQMLFVSPARQERDEAIREVSTLSAQARTIEDPTTYVATLDEREDEANRKLARLKNDNALADPARLVDLVQRLGDDSGVTVNRIDPKVIEPRGGLRKGDARANRLPTSGVLITVEAHGSYAEVTEFVTRLQTRPGFVRTEEVSLRPALTPGIDRVGVTVRTAQLAFDAAAFKPAPPTDGSGS